MTSEEKKVYDDLLDLGYFFNPRIVYPGSYDVSRVVPCTYTYDAQYPYDINTDIFALNSKTKDGMCLYYDFLQKNFYAKFNFDCNSHTDKIIKSRLNPTLVIRSDKKLKRRKLSFNYEIIFSKITNILCIDVNKLDNDYKKRYKEISGILDNYMKVIYRVLNTKDSTSDDYAKIKKYFGIDYNEILLSLKSPDLKKRAVAERKKFNLKVYMIWLRL